MNKKESCFSAFICIISTICLVAGIFILFCGVVTTAVVFGNNSGVQLIIGSSGIGWLVVGIITIFISIFGCSSVCCTSRGMLATYGIVMLLLSIAEICLGVALNSSLPEIVVSGIVVEIRGHDQIYLAFLGILLGTAAIELFGAIIGLVAAHQFQRGYTRFDQMQQPLVLHAQTFDPQGISDPVATCVTDGQ